MKMAKTYPKSALTVMKPCGNMFSAQKTDIWAHLGPKKRYISLKMPNGHFGHKKSKLKLMLYETVRPSVFKLSMKHCNIMVKLRVQYKSGTSICLGAMSLQRWL